MEQNEKKNILFEKGDLIFRPSRKSERKADRYMVGTKVFMWCLLFLAAIFAVDFVSSIFNFDAPELIKDVLEIIKTLLFTISGYLFGRAEINGKKNDDRENDD